MTRTLLLPLIFLSLACGPEEATTIGSTFGSTGDTGDTGGDAPSTSGGPSTSGTGTGGDASSTSGGSTSGASGTTEPGSTSEATTSTGEDDSTGKGSTGDGSTGDEPFGGVCWAHECAAVVCAFGLTCMQHPDKPDVFVCASPCLVEGGEFACGDAPLACESPVTPLPKGACHPDGTGGQQCFPAVCSADLPCEAGSCGADGFCY